MTSISIAYAANLAFLSCCHWKSILRPHGHLAEGYSEHFKRTKNIRRKILRWHHWFRTFRVILRISPSLCHVTYTQNSWDRIPMQMSDRNHWRHPLKASYLLQSSFCKEKFIVHSAGFDEKLHQEILVQSGLGTGVTVASDFFLIREHHNGCPGRTFLLHKRH